MEHLKNDQLFEDNLLHMQAIFFRSHNELKLTYTYVNVQLHTRTPAFNYHPPVPPPHPYKV